MTTNDHTLWQTKLAARLHDPAEKALVLLRDPEGHENGTSRALTRLLGFDAISADTVDADNDEALLRTLFKKGIPTAMYRHVQRADWWAAAADRPQWPMEEWPDRHGVMRTVNWARVSWTSNPVLIHPLSGQHYDLGQHGGLSDTDFHDIKQRSFDHHARLLAALERQNPGQAVDWKKALLTLWRFAPELKEDEDNGKLGELWKLLPADTRVPDHSIWDHLDLTSAFAGAFAADPDGQVALLTLSIGPVQPFIAAARKMEDLWAGSHLLARLSWEAMRAVCERLGPDAILFPRLRGVPQVDLWLRDACGLPKELFADCDWNGGRSDSNPLFAAALPNRFVAVVPAGQAHELAQAVQAEVRRWLQETGHSVLRRLLQAAGADENPDLPCWQQLQDQLAGFPEVHWAIVPFSLIGVADKQKQTGLNTAELSDAMRPFFGIQAGADCGFLATPAWKLLREEVQAQDDQGKPWVFFQPNPGVLYPAVHDLAERALAAAKTLRPFAQSRQEGWRSSLGGETEWLTTDRAQLSLPPGQRKDTLWTRIAASKPAWAKKGEHLGTLSAIKRLWPTLFAEEVARAVGQDDIGRFVVSTHTMALAHQLKAWLEHGGLRSSELGVVQKRHEKQVERAALPRRIMAQHQKFQADAVRDAAKLPALLDLASDESTSESEATAIRRAVRATLATVDENKTDTRLETYYGLLLMDGDHMGAWLAGDHAIGYRDSFHPRVQTEFDQRAARQDKLRQYGEQARALSPGRHLAISGALNDFSLTVVRHVVENEHMGRLIYAGGDDVFAMLPVVDLLPAMQRLRHAWSGHDPAHEGGRDPRGLTLHRGYAILGGKLIRLMGATATASCGAVVAHHQAPLAAVRRELDTAEQRAKTEGGRDAFSISIVKRSGGTLRLTAKWGEPLLLLDELRQFFASDGVSRRAAYHTLQWLDANELPQPLPGDLLQSLLAYQFTQQSSGSKASSRAPGLAERLTKATLAPDKPNGERITWLRNCISVAEFLAREVRSKGEQQ